MRSWGVERQPDSGQERGAPRIGVDVVSQARVKLSLERHGQAFLSKFLTPQEASYCSGRRTLERVSGRVAAKEAVMKVLGHGWPSVSWTDIAVLPDGSGRPRVTLSGRALGFMDSLGLKAIDVSITHDGGLAIAVALGVGDPAA